MKVFVTSIGERTTNVCVWSLKRFGFEVILLDKKEDWLTKYKRFIKEALKSKAKQVLRVDADVIVNKNIKRMVELRRINIYKYAMVQGQTYCFYKNDIIWGSPVLYSRKTLKFIKNNFDKLDKERPETSAWRRLQKFNFYVESYPGIVGMHGFFQSKKTESLAYENKKARHQLKDYDFKLLEKIRIIDCWREE